MKQIWSHEGPFDWNGTFFKLRGVYGYPRPFDGAPPIMNAAGSQEGRQFATRNADFLFSISVDPYQSRQEVIDIHEQARVHGRNTGVFTLCHVVFRPTIEEAQDYLQYYADENADRSVVDNLMRLQGMHAQSFPAEALQMLRGALRRDTGRIRWSEIPIPLPGSWRESPRWALRVARCRSSTT